MEIFQTSVHKDMVELGGQRSVMWCGVDLFRDIDQTMAVSNFESRGALTCHLPSKGL